MKKALWIPIPVILFAAGVLWFLRPETKAVDAKNPPSAKSPAEESYWTCPMHPQIHSDKPGECPICHMKLILVKGRGAATAESNDNRAMIAVSPDQTRLLGVQKVPVEKMDLRIQIPISGRLISPSAVAFQIYESDLAYVKPGLEFRGVSSFRPESEMTGTITSVDRIVDATSRTVRVVGQIKKAPAGLIAETTFRGDLEVRLKGVTAIPESAVLHTGDGDLVYLVHDDGSLMAQPVKLGQKSESYYEIVDGLEVGEFISSGPNFLIDSEARIRGSSGGAGGHTHH